MWVIDLVIGMWDYFFFIVIFLLKWDFLKIILIIRYEWGVEKVFRDKNICKIDILMILIMGYGI